MYLEEIMYVSAYCNPHAAARAMTYERARFLIEVVFTMDTIGKGHRDFKIDNRSAI